MIEREREQRKPDYYEPRVTVADTSGDPVCLKRALASPDKTAERNGKKI